VVNILRTSGETHINTLAVETNIPVYKLSALLFELEMKGVVRALVGGMYAL
jgi:DNA processing protein